MFSRRFALTSPLAVSALTACALLGGAGTAQAAGAPVAAFAPTTTSALTPARANGAATPTRAAARKGTPGAAAKRYLGTSSSSHVWFSGAWVGGWMSAARAATWGPWRGAPSDVTLTFPERRTWADMAASTWHIDTFAGFKGPLVYGLPLLPETSTPAELNAVVKGRRDTIFRTIARDLRTRGRGKAVVRIGWEANGSWMSYRVTARTAPAYRAAFRRVAAVMRKEAPGLLFSFDINCGTQLPGQSSRLDSLGRLYPGNDVVDLVGCSAYDWSVIGATSEASWRRALAPAKSVGLADVATFARAHRKGLAISEWGLAAKARDGHGDNPFYMAKMKQFFDANNDILVLESYFNASGTDMRNSLWYEEPSNPKAAVTYRKLW